MERNNKPVEPDRAENDAVDRGEVSEESHSSTLSDPPPAPIEQSINDAAKGVNSVWITLVLLMIYSFISTGKVSHKDLFLETPVKLPVLSVDVPLQAYFLLLPLLMLALHFYFSIQLFGLASKFAEFDYVLPRDITGERNRLRLHNSPFVEILGGPRGLFSRSITAFQISNRVIAWFSVVATPALLLFYIQLMYLPQQDPALTTWHRCALIADVLLTLLFIVRPLSRRSLPSAPYLVRVYFPIGFTALPFLYLLFLSIFIAVFPGQGPFPSITSRWLSRGADMIRQGPAWWFSNRLILSDLNFNEGIDLNKLPSRKSVRGRNLSLALFDRSDLRLIDFTGASLDFVSFKDANLQGSIFSCAYSTYPEDRPSDYVRGGCTDLRRANFDGADLRGVNAIGAIMHGALFRNARLDQANFADAQLQAADLSNASLVAADFSRVGLDGAYLRSAIINGANLAEAHLRGADFTGAELIGAVLTYALAQNATFARAQLQGASMSYANFEGADFIATAVYGTDIASSRFEGARIINVLTDRRASTGWADFAYLGTRDRPDPFGRSGDHQDRSLVQSDFQPFDFSSPKYFDSYAPIPASENDRIQWLLGGIPESAREPVLYRFSRLAEGTETPEWLKLVQETATEERRQLANADRLLTIACAEAGKIFVPLGLAGTQRLCPFKEQTISTLITAKTPSGVSCANVWVLREYRQDLLSRCK